MLRSDERDAGEGAGGAPRAADVGRAERVLLDGVMAVWKAVAKISPGADKGREGSNG